MLQLLELIKSSWPRDRRGSYGLASPLTERKAFVAEDESDVGTVALKKRAI